MGALSLELAKRHMLVPVDIRLDLMIEDRANPDSPHRRQSDLELPYCEPEHYWLYDAAGMPRVENGRRPAGDYFRVRANQRQLSMLSDEQFEELAVVDQVRQQVSAWRGGTGWRGTRRCLP